MFSRVQVALVVYILSISISNESSAAWQFNHGQLPFWVKSGSPQGQAVFDDQTVRFLSKRSAPWVVLNAYVHGGSANYNLNVVANRFREYRPDIKVLGYAWINLLDKDTPADLISMSALQGYEQLDSSFIAAYDAGNGVYYWDIANSAFRSWYVNKIIAARSLYGLDGFAFDAVERDPSRIRDSSNIAILKDRATADPAWAQAYKDGMEALLASLSAVMSVKFNTVYFKEPGVNRAEFDSQLRLYENVSVGAATEFWGGFMDQGRNTFGELLTMIDEWRIRSAAPQRFFIHGKPKVSSYTGYSASNNYERYLYGVYLLGALPNTHYNFISNYEFPWRPDIVGRSDQVTPLADVLWDLGAAESTYFRDQWGTYQRNWAKGKVVVYPHDSTGPAYVDWFIPGTTYYRSDRSPVNSEAPLRLYKAQAEIVFKQGQIPQSLNTGRLVTFSETNHPSAHWKNARILPGGYDKYLEVNAVSEDRGEYDLLLFPIRHPNFPGNMTIRYRTSSAAARLLTVAEVNDKTMADDYQVVFEASTVPNQTPRELQLPYFRQRTYGGDTIPWIPVPTLVPDGQWHTITFYANSELNKAYPDRYTYIRYHFVRFEGDIDIDEVKIGGAPYLTDGDLF